MGSKGSRRRLISSTLQDVARPKQQPTCRRWRVTQISRTRSGWELPAVTGYPALPLMCHGHVPWHFDKFAREPTYKSSKESIKNLLGHDRPQSSLFRPPSQFLRVSQPTGPGINVAPLPTTRGWSSLPLVHGSITGGWRLAMPESRRYELRFWRFKLHWHPSRSFLLTLESARGRFFSIPSLSLQRSLFGERTRRPSPCALLPFLLLLSSPHLPLLLHLLLFFTNTTLVPWKCKRWYESTQRRSHHRKAPISIYVQCPATGTNPK